MSHSTPTLLLFVFFLLLTPLILVKPSLFFRRHARTHRLLGLVHFLILLFGTLQNFSTCFLSENDAEREERSEPFYSIFMVGSSPTGIFALHLVMGISGIATTLSAAFDFQYLNLAKNRASGTLDADATVTYSEMVEHSFYQGLNLIQICFFHALGIPFICTWPWRAVGLIFVTSPWLARAWFPINHFSDNYIGTHKIKATHAMYAYKKAQYLAYKHLLFHGMNIYAAVLCDRDMLLSGLALSNGFGQYWMLLNVSYVMEFFLQTLVKRRVISQYYMLFLQAVLMLGATLSVISIDFGARWLLIAGFSLMLNFIHRGHDFLNTLVLASIVRFIDFNLNLYFELE